MKRLEKFVTIFIIIVFLFWIFYPNIKVKAQNQAAPPLNQQFRFTTTGTQPAAITPNVLGYITVTGRAISVYRLDWRYEGTTLPSSCTITLEGSNDTITWNIALISGTCTTNNQSALTQVNYNYLRLNMTAFTPASPGAEIVSLTGYNDYIGITSGAITDPCWGLLGTTTPVHLTTTGVLITATSGKKNNICGGTLIVANATSGVIFESTGGGCVGTTTNVMGNTPGTVSFQASEGFTVNKTIFGINTNVNTCWEGTGTTPEIDGYITVIQQ